MGSLTHSSKINVPICFLIKNSGFIFENLLPHFIFKAQHKVQHKIHHFFSNAPWFFKQVGLWFYFTEQ